MLRFSGLDPLNLADKNLLEQCQPGILKGHGRRFAVYCFIRINQDKQTFMRAALSGLPISDGLQQFLAARIYQASQAQGIEHLDELFCSISLSFSCISEVAPRNFVLPTDYAFRKGMKYASARRLNDPPVDRWEPFFRSGTDMLVTLASDNRAYVEQYVSALGKTCDEFGASMYVIVAQDMRDTAGRPKEAFGFSDGIGQPLFFRKDIDLFWSQNPGSPTDPSYDPREVVLVKEGSGSAYGYGSYVVARQIEQFVPRFRDAAIAIGNQLGIAPDYVQAQAIGRWHDGSPLATSPVSGAPTDAQDAFSYADDPDGIRCPLHAHTRKMRPRGEDLTELTRVIARRGVAYEQEVLGKISQGLLFVCYQKDISAQFEFLQGTWANDPKFPPHKNPPGLDAIIGQTRNTHNGGQTWRSRWGSDAPKIQGIFERATAMRGGEYLYSPSPQFLRELSLGGVSS
jgi:Dyp-type peroxidase family